MGKKEVVGIIVVSEQLAQIDFIEKVLKQTQVINTHQVNQVEELKRILDHESIKLIIIDDYEGTLGVGSVRSAVKDLRLDTPILQLQADGSTIGFGELMRNGATIVCPREDAAAISANVTLLLSYYNSMNIAEQGSDAIDDYRHKFDDLYQGLADPICYLLDGVFVDCNPAFLRAFEVADKAELQEMTIMQFVDLKGQNELKNHLRKSSRRDLSATPVTFQMQTKLGNAVEYMMMSKPAKFNSEDVIQVYLRSTQEGGGGSVGLYDDTTGLANKEQMGYFLKQKMEDFEAQGGQGILAYVLIGNYRDVWGTDGYAEAEKFISATARFVRQKTSSHTEISRYTDDGVLLYIPNIDAKEADTTLTALVRGLDSLTPEGMLRMVEPTCYVGFDKMDKDSDFQVMIGQLFRTARSAMVSGGSRVARPSAAEVAQKDTKRLDTLQNTLSKDHIRLNYQPMVNFAPDHTERYSEQIVLYDEEQAPLDLEIMMAVAERYQLAHRIDKWKIEHLLNKLLEAGARERGTVLIFVKISMDSLNNPNMANWLAEQMQHTGLGGKYFVFEMTTDSVLNAYSGAQRFAKVMREHEAKIAISRFGIMSTENIRIIDEIKPDFIKLDMREIDTLDYSEEQETMEDIVAKAKEHQSVLTAENIDSPAQLARIWQYGIKIVQGKGIVPRLEDMDFDFAEFNLY